MIIIAVDADREMLSQLERSLKEVFTDADIATFDNGLKSFRYFTSHREEVAQIYFPLTLRPFDGFKYSELVKETGFSCEVIFTTQTDNSEIRDLIRLKGANRYIPKPITPEKIRELAVLEQELCLDRYDEGGSGDCNGCIFHWCEKREPTGRVMKLDG